MIETKILLNEKRKYGIKEEITKDEIKKLSLNMPVQKIIGYIEMANVTIDLSKNVLIPRYETEELIFLVIDIIKKNKYKKILDLCCGSGFIGIAIKKYFQNEVEVVQLDIDDEAIKQSKINAKLNKVQTKIIKSNMFENINEKFDLIVSNPPYLLKSEKKYMSESVLNHEPLHALFANKKGLEFYEIIEKHLPSFLNKNGFICLEINPINSSWFINKNYKIIKDINQKERFAFKQFYSIKE